MKKILAIVLVFVALLLFLIFYNINKNRNDVLDKSSLTEYQSSVIASIIEANPMPAIDKFPSEEITEYSDRFNDVYRAVLFKNGEEIVLKNDDPKLIRFLNICSYSQENKRSAWSQGEVHNLDEALKYDMRLEIEFSDVESTSCAEELKLYDKAVVAGHDIWLIQTNPLHPTIYGDTSMMLFNPYSAYFILSDDSIDILEYIGF